MTFTDMYILAVLALSDCQEVMEARIHLKIADAVLLYVFTMAFPTSPLYFFTGTSCISGEGS